MFLKEFGVLEKEMAWRVFEKQSNFLPFAFLESFLEVSVKNKENWFVYFTVLLSAKV